MGHSRLIPQFTVLRLMVSIAVVAGGLAYLVNTKGAYWAALSNVPLRFTILDDASGRPIPHASVRLPGTPVYESPPTGDDGQTTVVVSVMCSGETGLLRKTRHANFGPWRIRVVAPGYKTFVESLEDHTQDARFHEENPNPPPIVIRMQREPERPASGGDGGATGAVGTPGTPG
ncbi:hypothetical protein [Paludisphaera rhizosphaerae]|uniref:hypothetical protein n=1 Tax=Paludisphaera rhizosphaerae TaxID=2711216 RepID=UPI0013EBE502|nr:hypothetical protein [Paludisphaera rhizosphaerae]